MSLLKNLTSDNTIQEEEDRVGGAGPLDSAIYDAKITMAYVSESAGGAMCLNTVFDIDGRDLRQRFWMTSGKAKGQKNYYETKTGEKKYLPGYNMANSLCLLTVGKEVSAMDTEDKTIALWNSEVKKEVPTQVPVIIDLLNKEVTLGVIRQTVDKVVKADNGSYQPTGETREENEVDKFFRAKDKLTTAEIRGQIKNPGFFDTWKNKWTGITRDKSTQASSNNTAKTTSAFGSGSSGSAKPTESLFN